MNYKSFCVAVALLFVCNVARAQVCNTFGNVCHSPIVASNHHAVQQVVAHDVVAQPNVFVINNTAPAPLIPQGATVFRSVQGYQAATLPFFDPNRYLEQELQLIKAADASAALRTERASQLVQKITEIQSPAMERIAQGQAAELVLNAAGLASRHQPNAPMSVMITRDASGQLQISHVDASQVHSIASQPPLLDPTVAKTGISTPLLQKFCADCHGESLPEPSYDLYLGQSPEVAKSMRESWFEITQAIADGSMPPKQHVQPSKQERALLIDELKQIIVNQP